MTRMPLLFATAGLLALAVPAMAESRVTPAQPVTSQPADEVMVRATPEMARGLARLFTREVLAPRYELDEAGMDRVCEAVARRLMATAHAADKKGMEFAEYVLPELIRDEVWHRPAVQGPPPELLRLG